MKGIILLANGFEDVEAIATIDVLRRSNIQIDLISIYSTLNVSTSRNILIHTEYLLSEINIQEYDFLIIPGGGAVYTELKPCEELKTILKHFFDTKKLICAICAAPILLNDFLKEYKFTCFKGCEEEIINGEFINQPVVIDKNLITAKSMYYSNDFGLAIISYLKGNEESKKIELQIKSL